MKWSVVGLAGVGVVAAVSAAVLVSSMMASSRAKTAVLRESPRLDVLVAARDLPAMAIVGPEDVTVRTITRGDAPEQCITGAVGIVGKALGAPVARNEVFTEKCIAAAGAGAHVAAALPPGMRAVTVSLPESAGLQPLIYPGSVVDIGATFAPSRKDGQQTAAISRTLLQGVKVLAVESRTIMDPDEHTDPGSDVRRRYKLLVTLMVTAQQANTLQLAMSYGTIQLTLRNPLDAAAANTQMASLAELTGESANAPTWPAMVPDTQPGEQAAHGRVLRFVDATIEPRLPVLPALPAARAAATTQKAEHAPGWQTTVIRGDKVNVQTFPMDEERERR